MTTKPDVRRAIETELGCALTPINHSPELQHHNMHYRGVLPSGISAFVKVLDDQPAYYTAEVRSGHHLAHTGIPTPRLLAHGVLDDRRRWLAYQWHDLTPFTPAHGRVEEAGQLLGAFHATTVGITDPQLRRYTNLHGLITDKIALVAEFDAPLAERIYRLHAAVADRRGPDLDDRVCLLHGDVGWRNLYVDAHDQQLWLIDFEHAAIGRPLLDFAKLWDRELDDPGTRDAFLSGYGRYAPPAGLRPESIDLVRLWAAAGIFPYARPRGDHGFERHARRILNRLESRR
ncbi:MAG: phosphotransferase family protein [Streptosporangiaceae bacterium]